MFVVLTRDCEMWDFDEGVTSNWGRAETGLHWEMWNFPPPFGDEALSVQYVLIDWGKQGQRGDWWASCPGEKHL